MEELCQQMNTNVSSLQTLVNALQENDYVTNVAPVMRGDEVVGYSISFHKADPITIYNGEKGNDGTTPIMGVRQDTDGVYYWTVDGEWLTDEAGNKIKTSGTDGQPGAQGVTPKLKIENGYWYVSYNNEETWEQLGQATGDGGGSIFVDVTEDEDYVYITLSNGDVIRLPKYDGESGTNIVFADALVKAVCVEHFDTNGDGEISMVEAAAVTELPYGLFKESNITSFNELRYFTNLKTIPLDFCLYCRSLTSITLPESITTIENCAFVDCNFTHINLPSGITTMGNHVFDGCFNLASIELPEGLTTLEFGLFYRCYSLTTVKVPESVTEIENGVFCFCRGLTTIYLPDNISVIRDATFQGCNELTSIKIPESVTIIENGAFRWCENLTSVVLSDNVSTIGEASFLGCGFTSFEFPASVTSIGGIVLDDCPNLTTVYCKAMEPPMCATNSFTNCSAETLYVPVGSREKYLAAEGWKDFAVIEEMSFE